MGVISACIPSIRPLLATLVHGTPDDSGGKPGGQKVGGQKVSGQWSKAAWRNKIECTGDGMFRRLEDPLDRHPMWGYDVLVQGGKPVGDSQTEDEINTRAEVPEGRIWIQDEVTVSRSHSIEYQDRVF